MPSPFVVRFQDDETFEQARDVLAGLEFIATLQIRTPLAVLQHHGEYHPGPPSAAPKYGSLADGFWSYKTKSWDQLAGRRLGLPEQPEPTYASDIGPIAASKYLPFLQQFRHIVEKEGSVEEKLCQLEKLKSESQPFADIWSRLETSYTDFPRSFFYKQLAKIPSIGPNLARRLFQHGFIDITTLKAASDENLKRVHGIGPSLIRAIRDFEPTNVADAAN